MSVFMLFVRNLTQPNRKSADPTLRGPSLGAAKVVEESLGGYVAPRPSIPQEDTGPLIDAASFFESPKH